jgi:spore germination cell wall hydrolase CwlJ-like protein
MKYIILILAALVCFHADAVTFWKKNKVEEKKEIVLTNGNPSNPIVLEDINPNVKKMSNAQDLVCLAMNIYYESRGEYSIGQMAVASVTINRLYTNRWGDDLCDVVWYKSKVRKRWIGQFSWTVDRNSKIPSDKDAWEKAQEIALDVWNKNYDFVDPTNGATHFHAVYVKPKWSKKAWNKKKIGRHVFMNTAF